MNLCKKLVLINILLDIYQVSAKQRFRTMSANTIPTAPVDQLITVNKVVEMGCVSIPPKDKLPSTDFIRSPKTWYTPMASAYFYMNLGETLIERAILPTELKLLCIKFMFAAPNRGGMYNLIIGGYKHAIKQMCQDTGFVSENCTSSDSDPERYRFVDNVGTIIATDSKSYFLMVRCVDENYREWALFTDDMDLDVDLGKSLLPEIEKLGFNMNKTVTASYNSCS